MITDVYNIVVLYLTMPNELWTVIYSKMYYIIVIWYEIYEQINLYPVFSISISLSLLFYWESQQQAQDKSQVTTKSRIIIA